MGPSSLNAQIFPLRGPRGALRAARYAGRATRAGVLRTARYRYRWSDPTYEKQCHPADSDEMQPESATPTPLSSQAETTLSRTTASANLLLPTPFVTPCHTLTGAGGGVKRKARSHTSWVLFLVKIRLYMRPHLYAMGPLVRRRVGGMVRGITYLQCSSELIRSAWRSGSR